MLVLLAPPARGQSPAGRPFRMGFMTYSFFGVDVRDARIATDMWLGQISENLKRGFRPRSIVFSDLDVVVKALQTGGLEVMNLGILDYLKIRDQVPLEPALVMAFAGEKVLGEYVLLVRRDKAPESLAQLRGKSINIGAWQSAMARMWLEVLLGRQGLPESQVFFGAVECKERVAQTILPVFFKQVDACIVERRNFATVVELNPQLGEDLVVWARLPNILPGVVCFPGNCDPEIKESVMEAALQLHTEKAGRQVLTLFRSERVMPFESDQLRGVLALVAEYERLSADAGEVK